MEPLKRENERVIKENNELHMEMIKLREATETQLSGFKAQLKQASNEYTDLQFLTQQKDFKLALLEKEMTELKMRLDKAL